MRYAALEGFNTALNGVNCAKNTGLDLTVGFHKISTSKFCGYTELLWNTKKTLSPFQREAYFQMRSDLSNFRFLDVGSKRLCVYLPTHTWNKTQFPAPPYARGSILMFPFFISGPSIRR